MAVGEGGHGLGLRDGVEREVGVWDIFGRLDLEDLLMGCSEEEGRTEAESPTSSMSSLTMGGATYVGEEDW